VRTWLVTAALLSAACSSDPVAVVPPPPLDPGVRALVLAVDTGSTFVVHAIAVDGSGGVPAGTFPLTLPEVVDEGGRVVLEALTYPDTLEALGLTPGLVPTATGADTRALLDTLSLRRIELAIPAEGEPAWAPADRRSSKLAAFRLPALPTGCARFETTAGVLDGTRSPVLGAEISPGVVMVGIEGEAFFRVERGQVRREDTQLSQDYRAIAYAGNNTVWLGGRGGTLVRANTEPVLTLDAAYALVSGDFILALTAGPAADGVDVFALTSNGYVEHFDGTQVRIVHAIGSNVGGEAAAGMARVGPREVLIAWPTLDRAVLRVKYVVDRWEVAEEPTDGSAAFISVAHNPAFGSLAGNSDGQFYAHQGRGWTRVAGSTLRVWPFELVAYRGGFLYGTAFGNLGEYNDEDGFCPRYDGIQANDVRHIVPVGEDVLIFGPSLRQPSFQWLLTR
jgi:hypothetical protein